MKIVTVLLFFISYAIFANCQSHEYTLTTEKKQSFTTVHESLLDLNYESVSFKTDSNDKNRIYFKGSNGDEDYIVNLVENGFDYDCSNNNFINIEKETIHADTNAKFHKTTQLQSFVFLLNNDFSISATTKNTNELLNYSYSELRPRAIVQLGNKSVPCQYIVDKDLINDDFKMTFEPCVVSIKVKKDDGTYYHFTSTIEKHIFQSKSYDSFSDSKLMDAANNHIGYFRFYFNAQFEFLDLNRVPI